MRRPSPQTILATLVALPALFQLGLLAVAVAGRYGYPYDLEWMEGGLLDHAQRYMDGRDLYVAPSVEFMPFLYTPLYPALLAGLGEIFGLGYQLGRAISLMAMGVTMALVVLAPAREATAERKPIGVAAGLAAAGIWAATYPWVEGWYDLVRADSLYVALVLGGLVVLRRAIDEPPSGFWDKKVAGAAALLALSFFAKQTGFLFVATGGLLLLCFRWRAIPIYVIVAGLLGGGGSLLYDRLSGGWYWIYAFGYHAQHEIYLPRFWDSFRLTLTHFWAIPALVLLGIGTMIARRQVHRGLLFWLIVFATALLVGALGWSRQWAHFNAFVITMVTGGITAAVAIATLPARIWLPLLLLAGVGGELVHRRWRPSRFVPTAADVAAGDRLIARLAAAKGDVFVPYHPWYARLAGKPGHLHRMGLLDASFRIPPGRKERPVPPEAQRIEGLAEAFAAKRYAMVILDDNARAYELPGFEATYRLDGALPGNERPRIFSGARAIPATIWVPKGPPARRAGWRSIFDFEAKTWDGWTVEGTAFGPGPVLGALPQQGPVGGYDGLRLANSYHGKDESTGKLTSPPFVIRGKQLEVRVGGGRKARVELVVGDKAVRTASGVESERMRAEVWDVAELVGQEARLVIVDDDTGGWGHILVDALLEAE